VYEGINSELNKTRGYCTTRKLQMYQNEFTFMKVRSCEDSPVSLSSVICTTMNLHRKIMARGTVTNY
jgi:hypothetical protein